MTVLSKGRLRGFFLLALILSLSVVAFGQRGGRGGGGGGARQNAPIDLTGYWVSVVNEDWEFRMVTPDKGVYDTLNLSAEGRRVADSWDPAKDEAAGEQCRAYGAANLMRMPGRLHITWDNDTTLKIETDAGTQTRLFRFGAAAPTNAEASWQGYSVAEWELAPAAGRGAARGAGPAPARQGNLKVLTTQLRPGYIRKNGVPFSDKAVLTEYFDRTNESNGDSWLVVTSILDDPVYLNQPFVITTQFQKQTDGSGWSPTPCSAR